MERSKAARTDAWVALLVDWYKKNYRELPWRKDTDPYHVWISEIMLQQTRIEAVMDYYHRFMEALPTVEDLANAPEEQVLKLWEGLGYYSRARNLHKAAKMIQERGGFPDTYEEIRALPGIGDYTAGAISAIAFDLPKTAVDGNVMRVVSRLELLEENVLLEPSRKKARALLEEHYPDAKDSGAFVQGLMELGEVICLPANPKCEICPLKKQCLALKENRTEDLPVRIKKNDRKIEDLKVYIIQNEKGQYLFHKRSEDGVLAGLWEFPNEPSTEDALSEKLKSSYLTQSEVPIGTAKHVFTHITWNMKVIGMAVSTCGAEIPEIPESEIPTGEYRWAMIEEIMLPTAFKKLERFLDSEQLHL